MRAGARKFASYDDILALPDNLVGEIVAGELVVSPRPKIRHARATTRLTGVLDGPFDSGEGGPGGWWLLDEPELHFGSDVLVPDLAGWRKQKLPALPDEAFITVAPDWVCEVLSETTAGIDRVKKLPIYAREKVGFAWLIDPVAKTLEVYRQEGPGWFLAHTFAGDDIVRAEPFAAIEIDLGKLWLP